MAHRSPLSRTLDLIRGERGDFAVAVVYSVAIGLLSLALPVAVQSLVNSVAFGSVLLPVAVLTIIITVALLASALLHTLRAVVLEMVERRIFVRHASEVLDSLLRFRLSALDRHHAPELVNRFLDVATVQKSASVLTVDGLTVFMQMLAGLVLLGAYHPYLLVFDIFLVLSIAFILFVLGRGAVRTSIAESRSKYDVLAWLQEVGRHSVALRSASGSQSALEKTNELVLEYLKNRGSHFRVLLRQVIGTQMLQAISLASLLGIGGYLVIDGQLTLGQLVASELVVSMAVGSFTKFGKSLETFYDLQAALDKLGHLTDLPLERSSGEAVPAISQGASLRVSGLTFGYEGKSPVLEDIDLDVRPHAKVAIHGRTAAGKSTLLDLLFGLRDPVHGLIEMDGVDYRYIRLAELRDQVMLVRGTEIFPGTVLDNLTLGMKTNNVDVRHALARAGVLEAVNALPQGLDTELSATGRPLAPSQAQRLTFARAILHRPRLLLIDEALDIIDDLQVEGDLIHTLFGPDAPWTLIVATERPELWPVCTRVYSLEGGRIRPDSDRTAARA